ncbi:hypothetical protein RHMOL_Rhmol12G0034700 [Rhododendron molle]|uniref:Uncharacterized protein n=1 Tax=Rhododendron molle TaxID=49168 RepID=A0ACC0LFI2_RHOML|nr:hypothetical protein RHMOL_Rhmol12G0034700 [Rhododendron molle]
MENKVATLEQEFNVEKKCVWGLCPDIFERIKLGKLVVNMITKIDLLIEKKFENGFLVDSPPARVKRRPEPPSTLSSSAHHTLDLVLNKLRDESTQKIGIWGMGGVGFPNANQQNGCKVVLTTRKMEVCRKMGTDAEVRVSLLENEEAWKMFSSGVGHVATLSTIKPYAQDIVRECDGLPLALKVVCGALRKEDNVNIWRNFLRELRSPATSVIEDLNKKVFKVLKVSYDQLKTLEEKTCLLFCGLYPEDSMIEKSRLIGYWRAKTIFSSKLTLEQTLDKGEAILQTLIDASLLEKCTEDDDCVDDSVKMHDVVRDLVLTITSLQGEEPTHLVRAGISSEMIPEEVEWKNVTRISFINHDLRSLPESPDCTNILYVGRSKWEIVLSGMKSEELIIPVGMICEIPRIEVIELTSRLSDESTEIIAKELSNLGSLSSLVFDFRIVGNLQHFLQNSIPWKERRLTQFVFLAGKCPHQLYERDPLFLQQSKMYKRFLGYEGGGEEERDNGLPPAIEDALIRSNGFLLDRHGKLKALSELGTQNTDELRYCRIRECVALETIVNINGLEMSALSNLEVLILDELSNLKSILCLEMEEGQSSSPPPPPLNANSFTNLTRLSVWDRPLIEHLFSCGFMLQQMSYLNYLSVVSCVGLKEIIPEDENVEDEALPNLSYLSLCDLPEFVNLFEGVPTCWQSLDDVSIWGTPKLRKLPFDTNSAPNLKGINGSDQELVGCIRVGQPCCQITTS